MRRLNGRLMNSLILLVLLAILTCGCGNELEEASDGGKEVIMISIGTGGTSGTYYPVGGGLAELINKKVEGMYATAEATGASIENARLVSKNELQIGIANSFAVYYARRGEPPFEPNEKLENLVALCTNHPSNTAIVVRADSPYKTIADLRGKVLSIGAPGGTNYVTAMAILEAYGLTEKDFEPRYETFAEAVQSFKEGSIDAAFMQGGMPMASIIDLTSSMECRLLPIEQEYFKKIHEKHPYYVEDVIPAGTYKGIDEDIPSIKVWNIMFTNTEMSEDSIYRILSAWYEPESLEYMRAVHPSQEYMTLEDAPTVPVPLHPGAERFWKEKGVLK